MNRRQVLAVGATALTGCVGESDDNPSEQTPSEQTPSESGSGTSSNEPGDETNNQPSANAEIVRTELIDAQSVFGEVPWLVFEVANDTDALHGKIEIETRFYDGDDNILSTRSARSEVIPSQSTWLHYQRYARENRDELARAEVEIFQSQESPRMSLVDDIEVYNTNLEADPEATVRVTGELEPPAQQMDNVLVLLYDSEDRFRGTILQPTTGSAFDAGTIARRTPPNRPQISDYGVLIVRYT